MEPERHTGTMHGENAKQLELLGLTQEDLEYWRQHTLLTQDDLDGWRDNLLEALESQEGLNRVLDRLYPGTRKSNEPAAVPET